MHADLSPDGLQLAFNPADMSSDITLWSASEGAERLGETSQWEGAPRFDPSGSYLAYVSIAPGQREIYVVALESGETWFVSTGGGRQAVWSRDGRKLFYRNGSEMWSVPIAREPDFSPGRPSLLFEAPYSLEGQSPTNLSSIYDVAADGRFLMLEGSRGESTEIRIIQGFHEELERLAPRSR